MIKLKEAQLGYERRRRRERDSSSKAM